jgi:hypothetical protein
VLSIVAPGTFQALGILLKNGRDFNNGDTSDRPFVALVNEALVRDSFPNQDPVISKNSIAAADSQRFHLQRARLR